MEIKIGDWVARTKKLPLSPEEVEERKNSHEGCKNGTQKR